MDSGNNFDSASYSRSCVMCMEGCVRFERAAPREAGDGPERRTDSSRETINDLRLLPTDHHPSSPSSDGERKPKKATD